MSAPRERYCAAGDVRLCYETFGRPDDPAVLLVMGLGTQMLGWPEDLCRELAAARRFVIRFDNRDCGRSTHLDDRSPPSTWQLATRRLEPLAYTLGDLAADAVALLDHLGVERAVVAGASMGGMIAQTVVIEHPRRVSGLVSIMAGTGSRWSGQPALRLWPHLLRRPPEDRARFVEEMIDIFGLIGSPGFDRDEDELRDMLELSFERGVSPEGTRRQLAAVLAAGDRSRELARIAVPTVVVHGSADRLISPSGGRATATAIRRRGWSSSRAWAMTCRAPSGPRSPPRSSIRRQAKSRAPPEATPGSRARAAARPPTPGASGVRASARSPAASSRCRR